VIRGCDV
jgi:hypothetical protein